MFNIFATITNSTQITYILLVAGLAVAVLLPLFFKRILKLRQSKEETSALMKGAVHSEKIKSDIILAAIEDGVMLINTEGVIEMFNPGAEKITGWKVKDAIGLDYRSIMQLIDKKNAPYPEEKSPFSLVFKKKSSARDNEAALMTPGNIRVEINLSVSPLMNSKGNIQGAVGVFRDVSQERTEEARRADFISTASHEMRTPVAAIEGYLALALNDKVCRIDNKAKDYLQKAHSSTQHLGQLFQDLLTSAKAEDGRLTNHPTVVEMGAYLEQLAEDLKFSAQKKGLLTEFTLGANTQSGVTDASTTAGTKVVQPLYYVHVDPDRIREVITNIFDNAVKYTETGKVTLSLTGDAQIVQISVSDTGPGIPQADLPHLFQKFYRVDNSTTRTVGGTGLGLFICRKIVELYQGRIWADSEMGKGSMFYINLPRLDSARATQLQAQDENGTQTVTPTLVSPIGTQG